MDLNFKLVQLKSKKKKNESIRFESNLNTISEQFYRSNWLIDWLNFFLFIYSLYNRNLWRKLNRAVQCFNNYRRMCINDHFQHSKITADFFDQMSEGPLGLTMELCNNSKFKQGKFDSKTLLKFDLNLSLNDYRLSNIGSMSEKISRWTRSMSNSQSS